MEEEKTLFNATVVFLLKDGKVWFAVKGRKIGKGLWNGYGGGIEPNETKEESAIRECHDESGVVIDPKDLDYSGYMDFHNTKTDMSVFVCRVHIFIARTWHGEPKETIDPETNEIEMFRPTLFPIEDLPQELMPADPFWFPLVLHGKKIIGEAHYGPYQKELLKPVEIRIVERFD